MICSHSPYLMLYISDTYFIILYSSSQNQEYIYYQKNVLFVNVDKRMFKWLCTDICQCFKYNWCTFLGAFSQHRVEWDGFTKF